MKLWTEARNNKYMKYHSKLTYQLSLWNVSIDDISFTLNTKMEHLSITGISLR